MARSQIGDDEMTEQNVRQALKDIASQAVPANMDLWPSIRAHVAPRSRRARTTLVLPRTRLGWIVLALVLSLMVGATGYALAPVVGRLFQQDAGMRGIQRDDLIQHYQMKATIDGVAVELLRAYADANRIIVGYAIRSDEGQRYDPREVRLTTDAGTVLPPSGGMGVVGQSDILDVNLPPGESTHVRTFDAAPIQGEPANIGLHLAIELEAMNLPAHKGAATPTPIQSPETGSRRVIVGPTVGPFTFDFTVPFIPARTAVVQQTVETAGVAVHLEQVRVTPSETRVVLCFQPPDAEHEDWTTIASLEAGPVSGVSGASRSRDTTSRAARECYQHVFPVSLYDYHGEWQVTVTELVGMDVDRLEARVEEEQKRSSGEESGSVEVHSAGFQTRLSGPWIFRFRVP